MPRATTSTRHTKRSAQLAVRKSWSPAEGASPAERQAHAIEYIAMYLDRIEQHMEEISKWLLVSGAAISGQIERLAEQTDETVDPS